MCVGTSMEIKMDSKRALSNINAEVERGYELKDKIVAEYLENDKAVTSDLMKKWYGLRNSWINAALNNLATIFNSKAQLYEFRDARLFPMAVSGQAIRYTGLIRDIDAKIKKLSDFGSVIESNTQLEIAQSGDQSRVYINSSDQSSNIINIDGTFDLLKERISAEYNQSDKDELIRIVEEIKNSWTDKSKKDQIRSQLSNLLSKAGSIASVAALVAQLLPLFV